MTVFVSVLVRVGEKRGRETEDKAPGSHTRIFEHLPGQVITALNGEVDAILEGGKPDLKFFLGGGVRPKTDGARAGELDDY